MAKELEIKGFIILSFRDKWGPCIGELIGYFKAGKLEVKEDISIGIESVPAAFSKLLTGDNIGKVIVSLE